MAINEPPVEVADLHPERALGKVMCVRRGRLKPREVQNAQINRCDRHICLCSGRQVGDLDPRGHRSTGRDLVRCGKGHVQLARSGIYACPSEPERARGVAIFCTWSDQRAGYVGARAPFFGDCELDRGLARLDLQRLHLDQAVVDHGKQQFPCVAGFDPHLNTLANGIGPAIQSDLQHIRRLGCRPAGIPTRVELHAGGGRRAVQAGQFQLVTAPLHGRFNGRAALCREGYLTIGDAFARGDGFVVPTPVHFIPLPAPVHAVERPADLWQGDLGAFRADG